VRLRAFEGTGSHGTAGTAIFGWGDVAYWTESCKNWEGGHEPQPTLTDINSSPSFIKKRIRLEEQNRRVDFRTEP